MGTDQEDPQGPVTGRLKSAGLGGIRRQVPALGIHLLGLGSAARGLTLDGPVPVGGAWGWKTAEGLCFVFGDTTASRWVFFGGAFLASALLGLGVARRPSPLRWVAAAPLAIDLAVCLVVGDPPNAALHTVGLALLCLSFPAPGDPPGDRAERAPVRTKTGAGIKPEPG